MIAIIAACEVGFWVFLGLGLAARYLLKTERLSVILLLGAPALDVLLLVLTVLSLHRGEQPELGHALAAIYLGFSITYGKRMIRWADVRFAHRFADGPPPERLVGRAYTRQCWGDVRRTVGAAVIACAITAALMAVAGAHTDTTPLRENYFWMGLIVALEILFAISYTIWPRKPKGGSTPETSAVTAPQR